tara:strand:+ start:246 stop:656 length:411 start_codon:yes stop_codon:yes gene_type:complete
MIGKLKVAFAAAFMLATGYAQAADTTVKVSARDCRKLVQFKARSNVNYKPGVDVRGRKVVGANLAGGHKLKLPSTVEFNIGFNPLKGAAAARFGDTSANVGKVKYDISKNTFTFNGQPINDKAMAEIARKCRNAAQ